MIPVTKPHLPKKERIYHYLDQALERNWLTNNGPLVQELTEKLKECWGVEHLLLVANGTLALQIAYKAVGITGKAMTTPFSFVATPSSLVWEGIAPVFVDIEPESYTLDAAKLDEVDLEGITGIVPTHVYGNACDVEAIQAFVDKHGLKTVYDGAHAAFVDYKGQNLFAYGDAVTVSFHATKLFHTVEGGAIVFQHKEDYERALAYTNFGLVGGEILTEGINAKMSEFHAAVGLANLEELDTIFEKRKRIFLRYQSGLSGKLRCQQQPEGCSANYAYAPVLFKNEAQLLKVVEALEEEGVYPRRYFYPSLEALPYVKDAEPCPVSASLSQKILCLPLYTSLLECEVEKIIGIINKTVG